MICDNTDTEFMRGRMNMKRLVIVLVAVSMCLFLFATAAAEMRNCASGQHTAEHTAGWAYNPPLEYKTCTQHDNCEIVIRYEIRTWKCSICGYRDFDSSIYRTTQKHQQFNK